MTEKYSVILLCDLIGGAGEGEELEEEIALFDLSKTISKNCDRCDVKIFHCEWNNSN